MKQGDFTALAKAYVNRPGYSEPLLQMLERHTGVANNPDLIIADVGAGTGKLTEILCGHGLKCIAVEPNDSMREEGMLQTSDHEIDWRSGSGEQTGLDDSSIDWVLMASSFHWVDLEKGLAEFHRILKPGGYFTALWNPRDLQRQ